MKRYSWFFLAIDLCIFISVGLGFFVWFWLFFCLFWFFFCFSFFFLGGVGSGVFFVCVCVLGFFLHLWKWHHIFTCIISTSCKLWEKAIHWGSKWQVMVDWKQGNWGFGGGREEKEKHSCFWGYLLPCGWGGVTMRKGPHWEGCNWENGFWALLQVIMSWMACRLGSDSSGVAKENPLEMVRDCSATSVLLMYHVVSPYIWYGLDVYGWQEKWPSSFPQFLAVFPWTSFLIQ